MLNVESDILNLQSEILNLQSRFLAALQPYIRSCEAKNLSALYA